MEQAQDAEKTEKEREALHNEALLGREESVSPSPDSTQEFIASSILTKYPGSPKITIHLDHIRHCKIILVIVWDELVEQMDPLSIL